MEKKSNGRKQKQKYEYDWIVWTTASAVNLNNIVE